MGDIPWSEGRWLNKPPSLDEVDGGLRLSTADQSDFWLMTGYGFTHYSGHALLIEFPSNSSMEVEFTADCTHQFDQAGVLLHASKRHWVKAGIELADGFLSLGAVVTDEGSDWSVGQVPEWVGKRIVIRVSRSHDAVTVRGRASDGKWRLVRLAPIDPDLEWFAGPFAASPTRAGLTVLFHSWRFGQPDNGIHA